MSDEFTYDVFIGLRMKLFIDALPVALSLPPLDPIDRRAKTFFMGQRKRKAGYTLEFNHF